MNERIEELSKEAWSWAEQRDYLDPTEKFAELIVQEFIALIGDAEISYHYLDEPQWIDAMRHFKAVVKEHFGVE